MKSRRVLVLAAVALFLTALTVSAQPGTWTAVGSTGTLDPQYGNNLALIPIPPAGNGSKLGFQPGLSGTIIARFNVTNIWAGLTDTPPWTTLELGANDTSPTGDFVLATLYQVDRCSGKQIQLCTVMHDIGGTSSCVTCTFPSNSFDFANALYYVQVQMNRVSFNFNPQLTTLRIHQ